MISSCYETKEMTPSPVPVLKKHPWRGLITENKPPLVVTNLETISFQNQDMENRYFHFEKYLQKSKINSQDYLITKSQNKYSYSIFLKRFKKRFLEAGWKQKINLKMLRHSRAAEYTKKGLNEPYMRKLFGWSKDSTMPSYYVELVMVEPKNWLDHIYLFSRNRVRENLPNPALQNHS